MSLSPTVGSYISNAQRDFAHHLYTPLLLTPLKPGDTGHVLWYRETHHALSRQKWFKARPHNRASR